MDDLIPLAFESRFDPSKKHKPYPTQGEYIRDILSMVSMCLTMTIVCKSVCVETVEEDEVCPNLPGSIMSEVEAVAYLSNYPDNRMEPDEDLQELFGRANAHIQSRVDASRGKGMILQGERLRELLSLSGFSYFAVLCALCSELDRGFERLFVALHGNTDIMCPTIGAVWSCYSLFFPHEEYEWCELMDDMSPANRLLLAPPSVEDPSMLHALRLRPAAFDCLLGRDGLSSFLSRGCILLDGGEANERVLFLDDQLKAIRAEAQAQSLRGEQRLCLLCGAPGSGRRTSLSRLARQEGFRFLIVRPEEYADDAGNLTDELTAAVLFHGFILCFLPESDQDSHLLKKLLSGLQPFGVGTFLLARQWEAYEIEKCVVTHIDFPLPDLNRSLRFWELFSAGYDIDETVRLNQLAAKYVLTPGKIRSVWKAAHEIARARNAAIGASHIAAAVLLENTGRLSKIADRLESAYGWDDLVLGDAPKQQLREVCDRIKYRHQVEIAWGFGKKSSYGNGISVLLYGPPGTGKTMSALVIANELELPLFRINLAQIISKYIGETVKNLDSVFNEAKSSNVILFFDEADALFAKRTDVKNSNDRHANSESSYLLQKIEEYSGVSILATNLANNFDEAFRRRIGYMININMPSADQRLTLWRQSFPPGAPLAKDVDLRQMAEHLEFSGSVIRSAAIQSAYLAASEGEAITMAHIARAVRRELVKLGKSEPHFLSIYS